MTPAERDACGVGFIADISGSSSHAILRDGMTAVASMRHRGALAADAKTGDGAGVLTQIPYALLRRDISIPVHNRDLAVGMIFMPQAPRERERAAGLIEAAIIETELRLVGWRDVPVDPDALGPHARSTQPFITQVISARPDGWDDAAFDHALYLCRRRIERRSGEAGVPLYVASLSRRTIVYKGLFSSPQLARFYPDLEDPGYETALAVFHQRYSTNTFPSWSLAQPFRFLAHNGEINTLQGNVSWMRAREAGLGERFKELMPIIQPGGSDSAMLDNVVELLVTSGRELAHGILMLVPEAWEGIRDLDETVRALYEYHACLTEPWDGPAALAFSDGSVVGAALDRNGLRPARFSVTDDGRVVMASEAGVLETPADRIVEKGRLGPGEMLLVDTARGALSRNGEIKAAYASRRPYGEWVRAHMVRIGGGDGDGAAREVARDLAVRQRAFGYTLEDVDRILRPMVREGKDPVFSMGDDTPAAVLSTQGRPLYHYFKQRFAQVTNPAIDPLRERSVMSLFSCLGGRPSLLEETPEHARLLHLATPILLPDELRRIQGDGLFRSRVLRACCPVAGGVDGFEQAMERLEAQACAAAEEGALIILSDREIDAAHAPIPMVLAVAAVHHELIRRGLRMRTSIVADTGDARDIHHLACLLGYGAGAICPYLALETIAADETLDGDVHRRWAALRRAAEAGLLKIMSKMGICTLAGYCGAQLFEAVGLGSALVERYFPGTPSRIEGIGLPELAEETLRRHRDAFAAPGPLQEAGLIRFRREGEYHAFNPYVVKALHQAARNGNGSAHRALAAQLGSRPPTVLRDLLEYVPHPPAPLQEVEPVEAIVRRFVISAMSHGALSREAHEALAVAANRLGARSNSGEGGEDPARYRPRTGPESANSRVKQIASARFGVTPEYILSADELEIKIAQGSKPGEGGQLPGHKVTDEIARIRRAQTGITLISPPPHHDIYSIEDLAQLIYDLKRIHPSARVAVKLVSEAGVGTIAAGVAKAFADTIQVSGNDGGTGASPLDSIKNAGVPWELGLAEVQQVLVENDLRARVRLRVDGGLKTGRDVVTAALLGADEFGFGSAAVVALGCVMARQCHLNTCPVGVATQREDLRQKFTGRPEMVIAYLTGVAEEVREIMAGLGARSLEEIIGRVDLLRVRPAADAKAARLDLTCILRDPGSSDRRPRRNLLARNERHEDDNLDDQVMRDLQAPLEEGRPAHLHYRIRNSNRAMGARLAGEIALRHGDAGLAPGSITLRFSGSAGQSFGAFCVPGVTLLLEGDANDSVGKGMCGGEIAIFPPLPLLEAAHRNVIIGNTALYGATGGVLFAAGRAGERFAVRNSGAVAVVEGLGDHGCEYMTGGVVIVLGEVGRNFAAGMTGGVAYVLDERGILEARCNREHVDLEPLAHPADELRVMRLLSDHAGLTGSRRAREVLDRWEQYRPLFRRLAPRPVAPPVPSGTSTPRIAEVEPRH